MILDASAVVALLFQEPGHTVVASHIGTASISTVNLAEVLSRCVRADIDPRAVDQQLQEIGLNYLPLTPDIAMLVAQLEPHCRPLGLSLGDRACLATALACNDAVLTTDRVWGELDLDLDIQILR